MLLLPTFVSFRKGCCNGFTSNFAWKIGAWATRIYAFAHARAFDRSEGGGHMGGLPLWGWGGSASSGLPQGTQLARDEHC